MIYADKHPIFIQLYNYKTLELFFSNAYSRRNSIRCLPISCISPIADSVEYGVVRPDPGVAPKSVDPIQHFKNCKEDK